MTNELILAALDSARAALVSAVLTIDATVKAMTDEKPEDPNAPCEHPDEFLQAAGAMGAPNRKYCKRCGEFIERVAKQ